MKKDKTYGFDYYLDKEIIDEYRKKPYHLRLKWLYIGNLLRKGYKGYNKKIIKLHNKFRKSSKF